MALATQTINLDLRPHYNRQNTNIVYCSQYDSDLRNVVVNIADAGTAVNVSTYTIYVEGTKPDKHGFSYELTSIGGTVANNVVTFPLQLQMTAVAGITNAELVFYSDDERIGSANFILAVEQAGLADDIDVSDTDIPAYVDGAQQAAQAAEDAKDAAVDAKDTAVAVAASIPEDYTTLSNDVGDLKSAYDDLRTETVTGKNILVTQPTRGYTWEFDKSKATFCKKDQPYAYSFQSVEGATNWRTTLNVWDVNGNKIVETDSTVGAQNAFSVVSSRFFASGIQYNDVYYTENGNGTYRTFIFTFNQDCYVRFGFYFGNTTDSTKVIDAQLEKGNVATSYEPYTSTTYLDDVIRIDSMLDGVGGYVWDDTTVTTQTGKYIPSTGEITDISAQNYVVISCSVTEGETVRVTGQAYRNSYYYAFYDANNTFVSGSQATLDGTTSIDNVDIVVPSNAVMLAVAASSITPHIKRQGEYAVTKVLKWLDKKWTAVGDSLTEVNDKTSKNYCDYISEDTGITVYNMGVSGSGYMRKHDTNQAFYNRVANVPTDSDVVTIFGSLNDLTGQTLGTIDDDITDGTVFGYVNATLDALYTAYPAVNIGIISPTPWKSSEPWNASNGSTQYCEGLMQICYNRGIPFLDLYHCSNLRPWDATARDLFYSHDVVDGVNAGCHPDEAGHKMIAPKIKNFLESLLM